jgi:hypothetical protein
MGAGASTHQINSSISLHLDHPGSIFKLDPNDIQYIYINLTEKDHNILVNNTEAGHHAFIEFIVKINRGNVRCVFWGKDQAIYNETEGNPGKTARLCQSVAVTTTEIRLQILAADTNSFKPGEYVITIIGGTESAIVQAAANNILLSPHQNKALMKTLRSKLKESEFTLGSIMRERNDLLTELTEQKHYILMLRKKLNLQTESSAQQREKRVQLILKTWRLKGITQPFLAWKNYAKNRKEKKRVVLGQIVKRLAHGKLYVAWRQWLNVVGDHRKKHLQLALRSEKEKRAAKMIESWRLRTCTPVFAAWKNYSAQRRATKKRLMAIVVRRLQYGKLDAAWRWWGKYTEWSKLREVRNRMNSSKKATADALILKWRQKSLSPAFQAWRSHVKARKNRLAVLMQLVVKRLQFGPIFVAFNQWQKVASSAKNKENKLVHSTKQARKLQLLEKITTRMQQAPLWRAWRCWSSYTENLKKNELRTKLTARKKQKIIMFVRKWRVSGLVKAFRAWRDHCRNDRNSKKKLLGKILLRLTQGAKYNAWKVWRNHTEQGKYRDYKKQIEAEIKNKYGLNQLVLKKTLSEQGLQPKYEELLLKYKRLQYMYNSLFKYILKFRQELTVYISLQQENSAHSCRCDICTLRRESKAKEGAMGWLVKFDSDMKAYRYVK